MAAHDVENNMNFGNTAAKVPLFCRHVKGSGILHFPLPLEIYHVLYVIYNGIDDNCSLPTTKFMKFKPRTSRLGNISTYCPRDVGKSHGVSSYDYIMSFYYEVTWSAKELG